MFTQHCSGNSSSSAGRQPPSATSGSSKGKIITSGSTIKIQAQTAFLCICIFMYSYGTALGDLPGVFTFTGVLGRIKNRLNL